MHYFSGASGIPHAEYAALCGMAYTDDVFRDGFTRPHGIMAVGGPSPDLALDDGFLFPPLGETEVVGFVKDDLLILCPRGTEVTQNFSWIDIIRDLRCLPWPTRYNGWNHAGFMKGARNWVHVYGRSISRLFPQCTRMALIGHSLGAALATQMALLVTDKKNRGKFPPIEEIVLFGEPKSMFLSSQAIYRGRGLHEITSSYRKGSDRVTRAPPWGRRGAEPSEQPPGFMVVGEEEGQDHSIENYIQALGSAKAYIQAL